MTTEDAVDVIPARRGLMRSLLYAALIVLGGQVIPALDRPVFFAVRDDVLVHLQSSDDAGAPATYLGYLVGLFPTTAVAIVVVAFLARGRRRVSRAVAWISALWATGVALFTVLVAVFILEGADEISPLSRDIGTRLRLDVLLPFTTHAVLFVLALGMLIDLSVAPNRVGRVRWWSWAPAAFLLLLVAACVVGLLVDASSRL